MQVQLQLLGQNVEVLRVESNDVFGDSVDAAFVPAAVDGLQNSNSCGGFAVQAVAYVVSVCFGSVFKQVLSGFGEPGQVLQVPEFVNSCPE